MAFDSDDEKEGAENQLLTSLENPLDAGDPDGSDRPPRYASASDFSFLPKDLKIITDGGPGCGGHLWPSAVILSKYLQHIVSIDPSRWQNKTCIELGAGTGIVACALASLAIPGLDIYSTDLAELLPLARKNVAINGLEGKVNVEELYWGRPLPDTVPHRPDLLLLADCIYLEVTFPWLLETMLLLSTEKTEILLAFKKRRKADKRFFIMAKKHFTFEHVQDDPNKPNYEREGLFLYSVKRKSVPARGARIANGQHA